MMSFFQSHYEKIILACLLVIFAVLLVWQVNFLQVVQSQKVDSIINKQEPASDQKEYDFSQEEYKDSFIFLDRVLWHPKPKVNDLPPRTDLFSSFHLAVCPFCFNLIPAAYFPKLGSTTVNHCPICGKDLKSRQEKVEPKAPSADVVVSENNDKNTNGVPDEWEKAFGVYFDSRTAIDDDPDGDHFTSYEEFVLKTNPMDPKSHPLYIAYTTVRRIERKSFHGLRYTGLASLPGETDKAKLEFNIEYKEPGWTKPRSRRKKLGGSFKHGEWTFRIADVVLDNPAKPGKGTFIIIQREGEDFKNERIECKPKKRVYDPLETVELWVIPYKKTIQCQVGKSFQLGDPKTGVEEYTVVSTATNSAVVVNSKGEKIPLSPFRRDQQIVERQSQAGENPEGSGASGRDSDLQPLDVSPSGSGRK